MNSTSGSRAICRALPNRNRLGRGCAIGAAIRWFLHHRLPLSIRDSSAIEQGSFFTAGPLVGEEEKQTDEVASIVIEISQRMIAQNEE